jgi:hypothetical protein
MTIPTSSARRSHYRYALLGAATLLLFLAAALALGRLSPYHPGLAPAPGYVLRNVTAPAGFVAGYLKEIQAFIEVTPCDYEILGWGPDGALYYRAQCRGTRQAWRAHPDDPGPARPAAVPGALSTASLSRLVVLDRVRVPTARPLSVEPWVREVNLQSMGYPSPDGRWVAFVAERVYGPQDVLLLREAP